MSYILISLSSQKTINGGHHSKSVGEQGEIQIYLLRHKTKKTEGRDKASWDISWSCKGVITRNLGITWDKQGTRDKKSPTNQPDERTTMIPPRNLVGETRAALVARNYIFSLIWRCYGPKRYILDYWGTIRFCLLSYYILLKYKGL